jgi:hypothetical protein
MVKPALALFFWLSMASCAWGANIQEPPAVLPHPDLTHHFIGYGTIAVTVLAYVLAMSEESLDLRKSKPMVMGAALVWFAISIHYAAHGDPRPAVHAFENNLLAYAELLLFVIGRWVNLVYDIPSKPLRTAPLVA